MPPKATKKRKANTSADQHASTKKRKRSQPKDKQSSSHPSGTTGDDDVPFTLECPTRATAKAKRNPQKADNDVFGPEEEDGGFPQLKITYTIRPGKRWRESKTFRNFSIQDEKFATGTLILVNKHMPPPDPPGSDASEAELLAFDKKNHWVGKVLEVKAAGSRQVWLRIFWLYWPEELPRGGRRAYHGEREMVMSNHMDIVNAQAVAGVAEVEYWDENVEEGEVKQEGGDDGDGDSDGDDEILEHRYWRQFYDVRRLDAPGFNRGFSHLKQHCSCSQHYNPDTKPDRPMIKCRSETCRTWNHQQCLEEAALNQTHSYCPDLPAGGNEDNLLQPVTKSESGNQPSKGIEPSTSSFPPISTVTTSPPPPPPPSPLPSPSPHHSADPSTPLRLKAELITKTTTDSDSDSDRLPDTKDPPKTNTSTTTATTTYTIKVTTQRKSQEQQTEQAQEPNRDGVEIEILPVRCLSCGTVIDRD